MKNLTVILLFSLAILSVNSQVYYGNQASKILPNAEKIRKDPQTGTIKFVEFNKAKVKGLRRRGTAAFVAEFLNTSEGFNFKEKKTFTDKLGEKHVKYQQYYENIPVEGMVFSLHYNGLRIATANGIYKNTIPSAKKASINYKQAFSIAKKEVPSDKYNFDSDLSINQNDLGQLVYISINEELELAYKFDIFSLDPLGRYFVYVDAVEGKVLEKISRIRDVDTEGTAVSMYSGTVSITTDSYAGGYRLRESGRGGIETYDMNEGISYSSAVDFTDADNIWNTTANFDNAAYDAHVNTEATYDYFLNVHNRNSYDNAGSPLISYVHYNQNYVNAFWNGQYMTYGDGDGTSYFPLTCIDIVAHEITHGVTEYTADLEYQYESGALNESFSDIFGVCVDFYKNPSTANWLMGEQISATNTPIRSFINPKSCDQPDTYLGDNWEFGSFDNGGVHINSGVQNYWFYLLVNGGSGTNDNGDNYNVVGIGIEKAAQIAYRNLSVYLSVNSQYTDAKLYSIQSAIDLFGSCSPEVTAVANAWHAVGLGADNDLSIVSNFSSNTYGCTVPFDIAFTNNSQNATSYLWNFGDGTTSTEENPVHTYNAEGAYTVTLIASGSGFCNDADTLIRQDYITIENIGAVAPADFIPTTQNPGNYGIYNFLFNTINRSSGGSSELYEDNTCSFRTTITEGKKYPISISTLANFPENVKVWIDFNNDGIFSGPEVIFESNHNTLHEAEIIIPEGIVFDTPLRLRIQSDSIYYTIPDSSSNPMYGQVEDYGVTILANTDKPEAGFTSDKQTISPGSQVSFIDNSGNIPTSWKWILPGASNELPLIQNPVVSYDSLGEFDVTLIAENAFGSDTLTIENYIKVVNTYNLGDIDTVTTVTGTIFDSGGPEGDYGNGENYTFLIQPNCADSIILSFSSFYLEGCCDYFRVYDGVDDSGLSLGTFSGSSIPQDIVATSGSMFIRFTTDGSVYYDGFEASWETITIGQGQILQSGFSVSDTTPVFNSEVQFTDLTNPEPLEWNWNFGDGVQSNLETPKHKYTSGGDFEVALYTEGCEGKDTSKLLITVQEAPQFSLITETINDSLFTNDTAYHYIVYDNTAGAGDLEIFLETTYLEESFMQKPKTPIGFYARNKSNLGNVENSPYSIEKNIIGGTSFIPDSVYELQNIPNGMTGWVKIDNYLYITDLHASLYKYDINTETIVNTYSIHQSAHGITYDGIYLWIADNNGDIYGYDFSGNTVGSFSSPVQGYCNIAFDGEYFLTNTRSGTGNIFIIDYDNTIIKTIENNYSFQINQMAVGSVNRKELWLIESNSIYKAIINDTTIIIVDTINQIPQTTGFYNVISHKEDQLYFGNYNGDGYRIECKSQRRSGNWIELEEQNLVIYAGELDSIKVTLNANNLYGGMYHGKVISNTNDLSTPSDTTYISLKVTGVPLIETNPKDSIIFDTCFVDHLTSAQLEIRNVGTDSLIIDSIYFNSENFTVDIRDSVLHPNEYYNATVQFSSNNTTNLKDTLFIANNSANSIVRIPLYTTSILPPKMEVNPDSINLDLFIGDTITREITIDNSNGESVLYYNCEIVGNPQVSLKPETINKLQERGVSINSKPNGEIEYSFKGAINEDGKTSIVQSGATRFLSDNLEGIKVALLCDRPVFSTELELRGANTIRTSYSSGLLDTIDVLVIEDYEISSTYVNEINQWINNGGNLIIDADQDLTIFNSLLSGSGIQYINSSTSRGRTSNLGEHEIVDSFQFYFASSGLASLEISGNAEFLVKDINENVFAAAANLGNGKVVAISDESLNSTGENVQELGINSIRWFKSNSWISLDENKSGSVSAGNSAIMDVFFTTGKMVEGDYYSNIIVAGNDPANSTDTIPVHMKLTGIPQIQTDKDVLSFGEIIVGATDSLILRITNTGTKLLEIDSIYTSTSRYIVTSSGLSVLPGESDSVIVVFSTDEPGDFEGYLYIKSNAGNNSLLELQLSTHALMPPIANVTPTSLQYELYQGDSTEGSITISNLNGGSELNYSVTIGEIEDIHSSIIYKGKELPNTIKSKDTLSSIIGSELYSYKNCITPQGAFGGQSDLDKVLEDLNENYNNILSNIPNFYMFSGGETGDNISDGGNDMYDGGNFINTNLEFSIPYTQSTIVNSNGFGNRGKYFTRKYGGLFILVADVNNLESFRISGNLGADGSGNVQGSEISMTVRGMSYTGYTKKVYNSFDPSVNHLIIVPNTDSEINHSFSSNTNDDFHEISGVENVQRIYYLLFAGTNSDEYSNEVFSQVMQSFLEIAGGTSWINIGNNVSGTIEEDQSVDIPYSINTLCVEPGTYETALLVSSNDPKNQLISVPVELTVLHAPILHVDLELIDFGTVTGGSSAIKEITLSNTGEDPVLLTGFTIDNNQFSSIDLDSVILYPEGDGIQKIDEPIVIDGLFGDEWNFATDNSINSTIYGWVTDESDLSGTWRAGWDEENLYLIVSVIDDVKISDSENPEDDDGIEIYLDGDNSKGSNYDSINDFQLQFKWGDPNLNLGENCPTIDYSGIEFKMIPSTEGYNLECAIPLSILGVDLTKENTIGLDIHINDDDNLYSLDTKKAWFATMNNSYYNPSAFGSIRLTDSSSFKIPVTFKPENNGLIEGNLTIMSSDLGRPEYNIALRGIGDIPIRNEIETSEVTLEKQLYTYPNPFTEVTNIEFVLEEASSIEFKIFNASGRQVDIIENTRYHSGKNKIVYNAVDLPQGLYYLQMLNNGYVLKAHTMVIE